MSVLIIGAGLIGSQVARILWERGEHVVVMDTSAQPQALAQVLDLKNVDLIEGSVLCPTDLADAIRRYGIEDVVHLAANAMLTIGAQRDPYTAIELNIMGTVNVLEAARALNLRRVVVASSSVLNHFMAGGEGRSAPWREEAFPRPTTVYASTKQAIESIGLNYATTFGVEFVALRYGAAFGPWNGRGGGGPSNVIRQALEAALAGREAAVPGNQIEWVYSKDAAMAAVLALDASQLGSRIFNITMGSCTSPEELKQAIHEAVPGARVSVEEPEKSGVAMPQMTDPSDLALASAFLGFQSQYGMTAAISDFSNFLRVFPR